MQFRNGTNPMIRMHIFHLDVFDVYKPIKLVIKTNDAEKKRYNA